MPCERAVGFAIGIAGRRIPTQYEAKRIGKTLSGPARDWLFAEVRKEIWLCANPGPAVWVHGYSRRPGRQVTGRMSGDDEIPVCRQSGD